MVSTCEKKFLEREAVMELEQKTTLLFFDKAMAAVLE
jgi:hypothetical protein